MVYLDHMKIVELLDQKGGQGGAIGAPGNLGLKGLLCVLLILFLVLESLIESMYWNLFCSNMLTVLEKMCPV